MPELPEIETVKLQLGRVLPGRSVRQVEILNKKIVIGNLQDIEGKKVTGIRRKAKVLLIDFEDELTMAFHFKMTGQLVYLPEQESGRVEEYKHRIVGGHPTEDFVGKLPSVHTRVIFKLDRGIMYFNDQRLFGWIKVGSTKKIDQDKFLQGLGPEPFELDEEKFVELVGKKKQPIKLVIMDQKIISGVGNIYANDACWEAGVDPKKPANTLTARQMRDLFVGIIKVLEEGIKYGGATAADAKYIDLRGLGGHYQDHFRVYDREGEECHRKDGGVVNKFVLGGRGTYSCPKCQV